MFYRRYSRIFFQVYLQVGSLYTPFIGYINFGFVFVFVSERQEKAFMNCQASPHKVRAESHIWKKINSRMQICCILIAGLWL